MGSSDIMKNMSSVGGHDSNHVDEEVSFYFNFDSF